MASVKMQEAQAIHRGLRASPRKVNEVAKVIRGEPVAKALIKLSTIRRRVAGDVMKVLESAIANAENNHQMDIDSLVVSEASVGKAFVLKRWRPRARGRAARIHKFFSHLRIILVEQEGDQ